MISATLFSIITFSAAAWLIYSVIISVIHDRNEAKLKQVRARLENENKREAELILSSGGPQSLEDYLFLFPEACPKCGSRDLHRLCWTETFSTRYADPQDTYGNVSYTYSRSVKCCKRCKYIVSDNSSISESLMTPLYEEQGIRTGSPMLSKEVSDSIPDFPYKSGAE
jgi:ATP-dependent Clp protease adaptor protein ClpS